MKFSLFLILIASCLAQTPEELSVTRKAAENGDSKAQLQLAHWYEDGKALPSDDSLALHWLRKAALAGNPDAENELGVAYRMGKGVPQDKKEAVRWYRAAARHGSVNALFNLGTAYFNGDGETINDAQAYAWFYLAQSAGDPDAADALIRTEQNLNPPSKRLAELRAAQLRLEGIEVPPNYEEAAQIYSKYGQKGDPVAQFAICKMLLEGHGMRKDPIEGNASCARSAKQGYVPAIFQMGLNYHMGLGVPVDYRQAQRWYEKAVAAGSPEAANNLATLFASGPKKDLVSAYGWFAIAAVLKHPNGIDMKNRLEGEMTPKMVADGRKKAEKWAKSIGLPAGLFERAVTP